MQRKLYEFEVPLSIHIKAHSREEAEERAREVSGHLAGCLSNYELADIPEGYDWAQFGDLLPTNKGEEEHVEEDDE